MSRRHSARVVPAVAVILAMALPAAPLYAQTKPRPAFKVRPPLKDDAVSPPPVMHFCGAHCSTLYLTRDGKGYTGVQGAASLPPGGYGLNIVQFDKGEVVFYRVDPPNQYFPQGLTAEMHGRIAPEGDHLVNAAMQWTFGLTTGGPFQLTWGAALDTIPGQGDPPKRLATREDDIFGRDFSYPQDVATYQAAIRCFTLLSTMPHRDKLPEDHSQYTAADRLAERSVTVANQIGRTLNYSHDQVEQDFGDIETAELPKLRGDPQYVEQQKRECTRLRFLG